MEREETERKRREGIGDEEGWRGRGREERMVKER